MKLEVCESLLYSWLRHEKNCRIVQTNWKPSKSWPLTDSDVVEKLFCDIKSAYPNCLKKNKDVQMLCKQAEIDVLGVTLDNEYFAIDTAFHLPYLGYDNNAENITKKIFRAAICLYGYFGKKSGTIIFATPKIRPGEQSDLKSRVDDIRCFLAERGFEFDIMLAHDENFWSKILTPVISTAGAENDTAELFLRSVQMCKAFKLVKIEKSASIQIKISGESCGRANQSYSDKKREDIGKIAYCFSKNWEKHFYPTLNQGDAFKKASRALDCPKDTLKNIRDNFDPYIPESNRIGWKDNPLSGYLQSIKSRFDKMPKDEVISECKSILDQCE